MTTFSLSILRLRITLFMGIISIHCFAQTTIVKSDKIKMDMAKLAITKVKLEQQNPALQMAYKLLLQNADKILLSKSNSVMDKLDFPPSGSKHDYTSLAPYWWPDPSKKDGLPYIKKDGQINPEVKNYPDKGSMPKMCEQVYELGMAYYLSNNEKYAQKATQLLSVWFLDTATLMNPNLNFAQVVKGINKGRGIGIIDTRHFIFAIDGIKLLKGSTSWTNEKNVALKKWFSQFLNWLQSSENGIDELKANNNHGVWYDAQCLAIALFVDDTKLAKTIVNRTLDRLDQQSNQEGLFPLELERTNSLHYSVFILNAFNMVAQMSEEINVDFWNKITPGGHSLKKSYDALLPYVQQQKKWILNDITPFNFQDGFQILLLAKQKYNCTDCMTTIQNYVGAYYPKLLLQLL